MKSLVGEEPMDGQPTAEAGVLQQERAEMVHAALAELSMDYRQILVLREIDGCRYDEIAEILDLPVGTVRSRLFRRPAANARFADAAVARGKNRGYTMSDENHQSRTGRRAAERIPRRRALARGARGGRSTAGQRSRCETVLHQCTVVSQSVQALPTVGLRRDLREEILRRGRDAETGGECCIGGGSWPAGASDSMPAGTLFQSRRPWIWASFALAAGLLIMFLETGGPNNKHVPAVAQGDGAATAAQAEAERRTAAEGERANDVWRRGGEDCEIGTGGFAARRHAGDAGG